MDFRKFLIFYVLNIAFSVFEYRQFNRPTATPFLLVTGPPNKFGFLGKFDLKVYFSMRIPLYII